MKKILMTILLTAFIAVGLYARAASDRPIPDDENIIIGQLDNGLTYYIRENSRPADRAELRLVVHAGSVLENDDQRGLAHFLEHMAFNGTRSFEKNELITYLQSLGMEFGPDLNAYTSFDETVYKLTLPTNDEQAFQTGLSILEEWAFHLTLGDEEIDRERDIIVEEWRIGRDASSRMVHAAFPDIFYGSKYGQRIPIGDMEVIKNCSYETLRSFYSSWYRPELMAVIVVGDIDAEAVEQDIIERFGAYRNPLQAQERPIIAVPDIDGTVYSLQSDPEADFTALQVFNRYRPDIPRTQDDYRTAIAEELYLTMMNTRLDERVLIDPDPPYIYSYVSIAAYTQQKFMHNLVVVTGQNDLLGGYDAALEEIEKVRRFGFSQSELDRAAREVMAAEEQYYNERNKIYNEHFVERYVSLFLDGWPAPSIEWEWNAYRYYVPTITLEDIQQFVDLYLTPDNRTVLVMRPETEDGEVISEDILKSVEESVAARDLSFYEDVVLDGPLVDDLPEPGTILAEEFNEATGILHWSLSNGAEVYIKPTDFQQDEILMAAVSPGGESLIADEDYYSSEILSDVIMEAGIGPYSRLELDRYMAGKNAEVNISLGRIFEEMDGASSVTDFETLMQLVYLHFAEPRVDEGAWNSYMVRLEANLESREADPRTRYYDRLKSLLYGGHPRSVPLNTDTLPLVDPRRAFDIYRERFASPGDFTFLFVGNIDPETVKDDILTYIGGLPGSEQSEDWVDIGQNYALTGGKEELSAGLDPVSIVTLAFTGTFHWSYQDTYRIISLADALQIRMDERIREEEAGTYSVTVYASPNQYPQSDYVFYIHFYCDPERVDELTELIAEEIDFFKEGPIPARYAQDVAAKQRLSYQNGLEDNGYWLRNMDFLLFNGLPLETLVQKDELLYQTLTPEVLQDTANRFLNNDQMWKIVLYPEDRGTAEISE